jgi:hypothetical protein
MKVQIVTKNMDFVRDFATLATLSKINYGNKISCNRESRFLHGNPWMQGGTTIGHTGFT